MYLYSVYEYIKKEVIQTYIQESLVREFYMHNMLTGARRGLFARQFKRVVCVSNFFNFAATQAKAWRADGIKLLKKRIEFAPVVVPPCRLNWKVKRCHKLLVYLGGAVFFSQFLIHVGWLDKIAYMIYFICGKPFSARHIEFSHARTHTLR